MTEKWAKKQKKLMLLIPIILLLLLLPVLATGLPMCEDGEAYIGVNCTLLTPTINCSGSESFNVVNMSGFVVIQNTALTHVNDSIYSLDFNLTSEENSYLVRLCDGTTREMRVVPRGRDNMLIAIAIIMAAVMFFVFKASIELDQQKHWILKMGLFYGALALGWGLLNFALRIITDYSSNPLLYRSVEIVYWAYSMIGIVCIIYLGIKFFVFTFYKALAVVRRKESKESKEAW